MSILSQFKQSQNTDFPNVRPSLDLRFALAKKLDPRITFTRGSTGTYFGSDGIMRTAGVNEPRFDHDPITGQSLGLLIEESRTNLITSSNSFGGGDSNYGITASAAVSPDGTTNASLLYEKATNSYKFTTVGFTAVIGTSYCASAFVKYAGSKLYARLKAGSTNTIIINLTNGAILSSTGTCGVISYPNGWYRIYSIFTATSTSENLQLFLMNYNGTLSQYQGDGSSGYYVYGMQAEVGTFPTSYIPTTASTVTRSADNASMTGTNFSSWYNQSEGTIVISTDKLYSGNFDAYRHPYKIDSGSNVGEITAYTIPGSNAITNYGITNTGRQVFDYQQIFIGSSPTQFKVGQSLNSKYSFFTSSKGTTPPQLPSKSAPNGQNLSLATNMSRLFIGSHNTGGQINSHIARLTYYPIQLTNQQLINLTS